MSDKKTDWGESGRQWAYQMEFGDNPLGDDPITNYATEAEAAEAGSGPLAAWRAGMATGFEEMKWTPEPAPSPSDKNGV